MSQTITPTASTDWALDSLRVTGSPHSGVVHLVGSAQYVPAQRALCAQAVSGEAVPSWLYHRSGCPQCTAIALMHGFTFARGRHGGFVSLRRGGD